MRIAIAVVAALCAAFCFALGSLIQQGAARQTDAPALRLGLLVALARQRRWLGGMAATVLAFAIQAVALAFGPLALVQPLVATEVLFALPMIARRNRLPLGYGLTCFRRHPRRGRVRRAPGAITGDAWAPAHRRRDRRRRDRRAEPLSGHAGGRAPSVPGHRRRACPLRRPPTPRA